MTFEIKESRVGKLYLSDGARIIIRLAITDISEVKMKPVGPDVSLSQSVSINTIDSPYKDDVKDKPLAPQDGSHLENLRIWEIVDIEDYEEAIEVALFYASDGRIYEITTRAVPSIVARTLEYRDIKGFPIYYVRWFPCAHMKLARSTKYEV